MWARRVEQADGMFAATRPAVRRMREEIGCMAERLLMVWISDPWFERVDAIHAPHQRSARAARPSPRLGGNRAGGLLPTARRRSPASSFPRARAARTCVGLRGRLRYLTRRIFRSPTYGGRIETGLVKAWWVEKGWSWTSFAASSHGCIGFWRMRQN